MRGPKKIVRDLEALSTPCVCLPEILAIQWRAAFVLSLWNAHQNFFTFSVSSLVSSSCPYPLTISEDKHTFFDLFTTAEALHPADCRTVEGFRGSSRIITYSAEAPPLFNSTAATLSHIDFWETTNQAMKVGNGFAFFVDISWSSMNSVHFTAMDIIGEFAQNAWLKSSMLWSPANTLRAELSKFFHSTFSPLLVPDRVNQERGRRGCFVTMKACKPTAPFFVMVKLVLDVDDDLVSAGDGFSSLS